MSFGRTNIISYIYYVIKTEDMIIGGLKTITINGKRSYFVTTRNGYQSTNCRSTPNHYIYYFVKDGSIDSLIEVEEILREERITHSKGLTNHIRKYFNI